MPALTFEATSSDWRLAIWSGNYEEAWDELPRLVGAVQTRWQSFISLRVRVWLAEGRSCYLTNGGSLNRRVGEAFLHQDRVSIDEFFDQGAAKHLIETVGPVSPATMVAEPQRAAGILKVTEDSFRLWLDCSDLQVIELLPRITPGVSMTIGVRTPFQDDALGYDYGDEADLLWHLEVRDWVAIEAFEIALQPASPQAGSRTEDSS